MPKDSQPRAESNETHAGRSDPGGGGEDDLRTDQQLSARLIRCAESDSLTRSVNRPQRIAPISVSPDRRDDVRDCRLTGRLAAAGHAGRGRGQITAEVATSVNPRSRLKRDRAVRVTGVVQPPESYILGGRLDA